MNIETLAILGAIVLNSALSIILLRGLHQMILAGFEELVSELPPALSEAIEGIEIGGNMEGMTPVQMAVANVIQSIAADIQTRPPQIEATMTKKGPDGKFTKEI